MKTKILKPSRLACLQLAVVLLLPVTLCAEETIDYWINFPLRGELFSVSLPAAVQNTTYMNSMAAIDLGSVFCDGVSLKPEYRQIVGSSDLTTLSVKRGTVIYQFAPEFFECWVNVGHSESQFSEIRRFVIPKTAKLVEIRYSVRAPDGKLSKPYRVTYVASDEKIQMLVMPQKEQPIPSPK